MRARAVRGGGHRPAGGDRRRPAGRGRPGARRPDHRRPDLAVAEGAELSVSATAGARRPEPGAQPRRSLLGAGVAVSELRGRPGRRSWSSPWSSWSPWSPLVTGVRAPCSPLVALVAVVVGGRGDRGRGGRPDGRAGGRRGRGDPRWSPWCATGQPRGVLGRDLGQRRGQRVDGRSAGSLEPCRSRVRWPGTLCGAGWVLARCPRGVVRVRTTVTDPRSSSVAGELPARCTSTAPCRTTWLTAVADAALARRRRRRPGDAGSSHPDAAWLRDGRHQQRRQRRLRRRRMPSAVSCDQPPRT